jgi:hypothetical protein
MSNRLSLICVTLIAFLFVSCTSSSPTIQQIDVDLDPSDSIPLSAEVTLQTDRSTTVALEFVQGDRSWKVDTNLPAGTEHVVPNPVG